MQILFALNEVLRITRIGSVFPWLLFSSYKFQFLFAKSLLLM